MSSEPRANESDPLLQDDSFNVRPDDVDSDKGIQGEDSKRIIICRTSLRLIGVAVAVTAAVAVILAVVLTRPSVSLLGLKPGGEDEIDPQQALDIRLKKYQTPSDTTSCADWISGDRPVTHTSPMINSSVSFELDPTETPALLFFLSRGRPLSGEFHLLDGRWEPYGQRMVRINVTATHNDSKEAMDKLKTIQTCIVDGGGDEKGLMIWADAEQNVPVNDIRFTITVQLPNRKIFNDLSTDFSNGAFSQYIGNFFDLFGPSSFETVRLYSKNALLFVIAMVSSSVYAQTSNGSIRGSFWFADQVDLHTTNATIQAVAGAFGQYDGAESFLNISTTNGVVEAAVGLLSDYSSTKLYASVHTTSAPLTICPHSFMQLDTETFVLDASTSYANASLYLTDDYEGAFDMTSTGETGKAYIERDSNIPDPQRKGRKWVIESEVDEEQYKKGRMYWGAHGPEKTLRCGFKLTTSEGDVLAKFLSHFIGSDPQHTIDDNLICPDG